MKWIVLWGHAIKENPALYHLQRSLYYFPSTSCRCLNNLFNHWQLLSAFVIEKSLRRPSNLSEFICLSWLTSVCSPDSIQVLIHLKAPARLLVLCEPCWNFAVGAKCQRRAHFQDIEKFHRYISPLVCMRFTSLPCLTVTSGSHCSAWLVCCAVMLYCAAEQYVSQAFSVSGEWNYESSPVLASISPDMA